MNDRIRRKIDILKRRTIVEQKEDQIKENDRIIEKDIYIIDNDDLYGDEETKKKAETILSFWREQIIKDSEKEEREKMEQQGGQKFAKKKGKKLFTLELVEETNRMRDALQKNEEEREKLYRELQEFVMKYKNSQNGSFASANAISGSKAHVVEVIADGNKILAHTSQDVREAFENTIERSRKMQNISLLSELDEHHEAYRLFQNAQSSLDKFHESLNNIFKMYDTTEFVDNFVAKKMISISSQLLSDVMRIEQLEDINTRRTSDEQMVVKGWKIFMKKYQQKMKRMEKQIEIEKKKQIHLEEEKRKVHGELESIKENPSKMQELQSNSENQSTNVQQQQQDDQEIENFDENFDLRLGIPEKDRNFRLISVSKDSKRNRRNKKEKRQDRLENVEHIEDEDSQSDITSDDEEECEESEEDNEESEEESEEEESDEKDEDTIESEEHSKKKKKKKKGRKSKKTGSTRNKKIRSKRVSISMNPTDQTKEKGITKGEEFSPTSRKRSTSLHSTKNLLPRGGKEKDKSNNSSFYSESPKRNISVRHQALQTTWTQSLDTLFVDHLQTQNLALWKKNNKLQMQIEDLLSQYHSQKKKNSSFEICKKQEFDSISTNYDNVEDYSCQNQETSDRDEVQSDEEIEEIDATHNYHSEKYKETTYQKRSASAKLSSLSHGGATRKNAPEAIGVQSPSSKLNKIRSKSSSSHFPGFRQTQVSFRDGHKVHDVNVISNSMDTTRKIHQSNSKKTKQLNSPMRTPRKMMEIKKVQKEMEQKSQNTQGEIASSQIRNSILPPEFIRTIKHINDDKRIPASMVERLKELISLTEKESRLNNEAKIVEEKIQELESTELQQKAPDNERHREANVQDFDEKMVMENTRKKSIQPVAERDQQNNSGGTTNMMFDPVFKPTTTVETVQNPSEINSSKSSGKSPEPRGSNDGPPIHSNISTHISHQSHQPHTMDSGTWIQKSKQQFLSKYTNKRYKCDECHEPLGIELENSLESPRVKTEFKFEEFDISKAPEKWKKRRDQIMHERLRNMELILKSFSMVVYEGTIHGYFGTLLDEKDNKTRNENGEDDLINTNCHMNSHIRSKKYQSASHHLRPDWLGTSHFEQLMNDSLCEERMQNNDSPQSPTQGSELTLSRSHSEHSLRSPVLVSRPSMVPRINSSSSFLYTPRPPSKPPSFSPRSATRPKTASSIIYASISRKKPK